MSPVGLLSEPEPGVGAVTLTIDNARNRQPSDAALCFREDLIQHTSGSQRRRIVPLRVSTKTNHEIEAV